MWAAAIDWRDRERPQTVLDGYEDLQALMADVSQAVCERQEGETLIRVRWQHPEARRKICRHHRK